MARAIELMDVHAGTLSDPVSPSTVTAYDVEVAFPYKLGELLGRKPFPQKLYAPSFAISCVPIFSEPIAKGPVPKNALRQKPPEPIPGQVNRLREHRPGLAANQAGIK
jgi:hypothetical protein